MNKTASALSIAISLLVAGCATTSGPSKEVIDTGFLSDYSKLHPVKGQDGFLGYVAPSAELKTYTKIYFDPVQVFLSTKPDTYKGIRPDVLQRICDSFRAAFIKSASADYQVVDAPGPGVLRARLAITGLQPVPTALSPIDFLPIKVVFDAGRAAAGDSPRLAELSVQIEVLNDQGVPVGGLVASRDSEDTLEQNDKITWKDLVQIVNTLTKTFWSGLDKLRAESAAR